MKKSDIDIKHIEKYLKIKGIYETKNGITYDQYHKKLNPDKFTW